MDVAVPRIVLQRSMRLVGLEHVGAAGDGEIPALWRAFMPRMGEVRRIKDTFGFARKEGRLVYLVGSQVADFDEIPGGMVGREVAGGPYAFVECPSLDQLAETLRWFYEEWIPTSGYVGGDGLLEYYPPTFPRNPSFELRLAVLPRSKWTASRFSPVAPPLSQGP